MCLQKQITLYRVWATFAGGLKAQVGRKARRFCGIVYHSFCLDLTHVDWDDVRPWVLPFADTGHG
jgi:hypothetical protein